MLNKIGLLCKGNDEQVPFAYELYEREDEDSNILAKGFKETFGTPVDIEFIGVWETVSSVGMVRHKTLPFTSSNNSIRVFRHALALDERRVFFKPSGRMRNPTNQEIQRTAPASKVPTTTKPVTDVLEVWFPGCHGDVGGGSVLDIEPHNLGNISLRWMVCEVLAAQCGVLFDAERLSEKGVYSTVPGYRPPLEDTDVCANIHDELGPQGSRWWNLLERVPLPHKQMGYITFDERHQGRGRRIPDVRPNFHMSVIRRMEQLGYEPRATWSGEANFVD
ncbi:uncharacterized protein PHACADRAFT_265087 [Phanerochaete carnosa HHB-10118-sp]|uniref:T6SS Phospholipase effector Tle1-like catalytic domain-containing protein n=1 Tax=Phanerochaete carnosa (strain HHB-10118-sp) TaxID=650164 RepID=K5VS00_PHACS|nr:uncharacterized protein PHACADRAFT_265087 [Phanerochaete carnosa HHB-10118-sp]EKM49550.1 hypothetical protein PHACADRAFT_265087 [Phanerochaete carnosa HHB-10118-sp]